jgi:predicted ATPase/DNA-binding winged helix-turn-helix (wHTH) protein
MNSTPGAPPPEEPTAMSPVYRFGDFELQPDQRLLLRHGQPLTLTARAFGVLVALVERAGQLVSKDELMQRVWAGLVVEENNIAVHVAQLRKLLGAPAISTIAGCGYRFALEVSRDDAQPAPRAADPDDLPGNLPARTPALIGREQEQAELDALLDAHPLVTVCGGPGVGKTLLAMAAAARRRSRYRDGTWWIDLAPLTDGAQIALTIAGAMGLNPVAGDDTLAALARRLKPRSLLLVLDNADHLAPAVARLAAALVQSTPRVSVLVTSQVPLRDPAQRLLRLGPLGLPAPGASVDEAVRCGAVQLLAERAAGAGSPLSLDARSIDAATDICRRLDGNPLAIELAAARLPALGLAALAERLQQRLGLLAPLPQVPASRQNALAAALDWSHGLLSPTEQQVFRRLGVFPGAFELDRAALCLADDSLPAPRVIETLLDLADRSLLSVDRASAPRYRLPESIRLHALDKLQASGESAAVRAAFARGMRSVFDEAYEDHWRSNPNGVPGAWRERWAPELDDLRAALDEAAANDPDTAVALYGSSSPLWGALLLQAEARERGEALVGRLSDALPKPVLARFWEALARAHSTEYPLRCRAAAELAAQRYAELEDTRGEYLAWAEFALNWRIDHPEARRALARAKAIEDPRWSATVLTHGRTTEAVLDFTGGDVERARETLLSLAVLCERDGYLEGTLRTGANLVDVDRHTGRTADAIRRGEALLQRLPPGRASANEFTLFANLVGALLDHGDVARARAVVSECAKRLRRLPEDSCMWSMLDLFGRLHALSGRPDAAARLAGASDRAYRDRGRLTRQPNEDADRVALAELLARHADAIELAGWRAEGELLAIGEACELAFEAGG